MKQNQKEKNLRAILVCGYAWSGSSAVLDLLKELKSYKHFEPEFRLITDPGGILDLENAITNNKSYTVVNKTIKHFKNIIEIYGRKFHWWSNVKITRIFEKIGFNYNKYMNDEFNHISEEYIEKLIELEYNGDLITDFYDLNRLKFLFIKAKFSFHKISRRKMKSSNKIFFSSKSSDEFLEITREYMKDLCRAIIQNEEVNRVVFDQGVQPSNAIKGMRFFDSVKSIIVDRDPRDIFSQTYDFLFNTSIPNRNVKQFIKWYKLSRKGREQSEKSDDILFIQFEDLIFNYEKVTKQIFNFLNESSSNHIDKNKYLKPEESKKNIGIWRNFKHQNYINEIEKELNDFCWKE